MNKAKLKSYAPQARKHFIAAVTARANLLGLSDKGGKLDVAASQPQGDTTVIAGQAWPVKVHSQRQQLIARIQKEGFAQTMEAVAYTWFNRFAALRYMELHDYLGHGHRALSSLEGTLPDILAHAADLAQGGDGGLPGLKPALVVEMKLVGNRDGELYSMLLVAQCNALSNVMPFLFERIDDETELLLPDNLLRTDSVIAKLVASIEEEDWKEVEIIGWLYQFYISEKKDEVIGKVVNSEDIPAATQLFTPNWIVRYLVQNSVGRLWLMANPASTLQTQWPYYIAPADQTPEVQAQLAALIQTRMVEDGGSLNPETMTMLDPACGSGHILVEAYEVFKAIYLERGYQPRSIPRLILEKNLFGLDIDDRAAQMAGFALLMKARADDRRLFNEPVRLNVLSLQESKGISLDEISTHLTPFSVPRTELAALLDAFAYAKTFGSLIQVPSALNGKLTAMAEHLHIALLSGDLYAKAAAQELLPLVAQAKLLAMQFDAVVANPPYMGGLNGLLKDFAAEIYPNSKSDLYSMFIEQGMNLVRKSGYLCFVTMQSWMFLLSYENLRRKLLVKNTIYALAHLGPHAFEEIQGERVQVCCFSIMGKKIDNFLGTFHRLILGNSDSKREGLLQRLNQYPNVNQDVFLKLSDSSIAYKLSKSPLLIEKMTAGKLVKPGSKIGSQPGSELIIFWWEVSRDNIGNEWRMYNKGGVFRKWYGNQLWILRYGKSGEVIVKNGGSLSNQNFYFRSHISWTRVSSKLNLRFYPDGFGFDNTSPAIFENKEYLLGFLNSCVGEYSRTIKFSGTKIESGHVESIAPFDATDIRLNIEKNTRELISIHKNDWDNLLISVDFSMLPFLPLHFGFINESWEKQKNYSDTQFDRVRYLEEENNRQFIDAYGLQDELSPEVPESQITLARADRERDCQRLIAYAIGCMMGRYSLDEPALIYAKAGNVGFDATRYHKFPADFDGIVPLNDEIWFEDEAATRIREFLLAVWGADTLAENMAWLAESLGAKAGETPDETIRRYLADKFYKDHLQTYKKRPIYWLFSSGKQGAFQALVYLHRYHEGTLSRMRAEYVVPLTGKIQSRIDMLEKDAAAATSTAARNKLTKEVEKLKKKHVELLAYDEQLRHYADMRITLDLDDGVKVNYGKFGDLLAEVKAVTGGASDD